MAKQLLDIEFRYLDAPRGDYDSQHKNKKVTIGIYDTIEEAIEKGNELLKNLSDKFTVNHDDQFKKVYLFGSPKRLVVCQAKGVKYRTEFYAHITELNFDDINTVVNNVFHAHGRYDNWIAQNED